ncbi:MAG: hypothetical protein LQ346_002880 [Caloplaca aetnensis]|nr:MAG: hypothetical protein LQ346_002880 [Caloplaca aetnensis]
MPGALTLDDHEGYLSSSSGEISEPTSHDSMDTVRPQNEEEPRQEEETRPSSKPLQEEYENLPPPSDIHRLPRHWARFPAWRPLAKQAKKPDFHFKNPTQRENIFMRWKESFLVPDHRVREISGASFEGFYYICFNQVSGDINGIYFHSKSEKFQQLELKHVPDRGCYPAMEFR